MSRNLPKIERLDADLVRPTDAKQVDFTDRGEAVLLEETQRSGSEPDVDPATGKQRFRRHPISGENLVGIRKPTFFTLRREYVQHSEGNGNVRKEDYHRPSPEEVARMQREQRLAQIRAELDEALLDNDIDVTSLVRVLRGDPVVDTTAPAAQEDEGLDEEPEEEGELNNGFPERLPGVGKYLLSNGEVMEKTKKADAIKAQDKINEAEAEAKANSDAIGSF